MSEDRIYAMPLDRVGDFRFDEQVAEVFPDMIARSVPGYGSVLAMTAELAARFAREGTHIYDLGCSLGAASLLMQSRVPPSCQIHAVDSSAAMLQKLEQQLRASSRTEGATITLHHADVCDLPVQAGSFVVLNFTLQFVPLEGRHALLQSVYDGLLPQGALVLSEKIHFTDETRQALMTELHHDFKRANGYTDLEIAQKRTAIENTLVTEPAEQHLSRLTEIGFHTVSIWFQCFQFVSILAIK